MEIISSLIPYQLQSLISQYWPFFILACIIGFNAIYFIAIAIISRN